MRIGVVVKTARSHDARARPADSAGVRCELPGQIPGLAAVCGATQ
jgi:hypothetical protein